MVRYFFCPIRHYPLTDCYSRVNQGTDPSSHPSLLPTAPNGQNDSVSQNHCLTLKNDFIRVAVSDESITIYNDLKLGKKLKYIIYKLSDDYKEIVVEDYSAEQDYEVFQNKLLNAKASYKGKEGRGPRYAVYDFQWELENGEGTRNQLCFISWSPDDGTLVFVSFLRLLLDRESIGGPRLISYSHE